MEGSDKTRASCLCGSVKVEVGEVNPNFTVCHCDTCRSWGGGPLFAVQCGTDVQFEGSEMIKEYESSPWATRGFCGKCGTHLFYRLNKTGSYNMPLGLIPELSDLVMSMQYFSDQRPDYYCFSNESKEMTKAEIEVYFASLV
ncbi:aldehyde-activating protein [Enterovibrio norvegicus FF-33]|uniref:Aldehyde-activating protein n=1 Tax=Enterovibrio norvegicus FF-454 TaxID=1185651 RepID=A0A1E5C3D8_9GAMM|nr:GFA family protein [Enterovibrio norvegicus]OEE60003.1 aldehyde-activating protein [Enterovibrio norvegicus FF-454]OEE67073.1 aldehyde-activating protein [Enterovibrio norvegicus FF-33]